MATLGYTFLLLLFTFLHAQSLDNSTVLVAAFIEEEHGDILPYFLGTLDRLDYPKSEIILWLHIDSIKHSQLVFTWLEKADSQYKRVKVQREAVLPGAKQVDKELQRIAVREAALQFARQQQVQYALFIDAIVMVTDVQFLSHLREEMKRAEAVVLAPLVICPDTFYTNFWGQISEEGWYKRSSDYMDILYHKEVGTFKAQLLHSVYMIDMHHHSSPELCFDVSVAEGVWSDPDLPSHYLQFAYSAQLSGVQLAVSNSYQYGFLPAPSLFHENENGKQLDYMTFLHQLADHDVFLQPTEMILLSISDLAKDFEKIYIINLPRRVVRKYIMEQVMYSLGVSDFVMFEAVDGRSLNATFLDNLGVKAMEGYMDPYHNRPMKAGEIGCFLSHYYIWREALEKKYKRILILEDDAMPITDMLSQYALVMSEANRFPGDWDLLYLGRKIIIKDEKPEELRYIKGFQHIYYPGYSYWCVAYALTGRGLEKLIMHNPLSRMLPTDEYIPILMNTHPNSVWKEKFHPRNLIALSADPLLIYPRYYPGEEGYYSDTEDWISAPRKDEL